VTAHLCHLPNAEPGQHARLEVDGVADVAVLPWPVEITVGDRRYLHLSGDTYLRWSVA
jgi:hypothetical protein